MHYINPLEILQLKNTDEEITNDIVKKAKRKLFAEIDLSDEGYLNYYGKKVTKGECERVINEAVDKNQLGYYKYVLKNQKLNDFLIHGNSQALKGIKHEPIFTSRDFVNFISPYFTEKFNNALRETFISNNEIMLKTLVKLSILISSDDINRGYTGLSVILNNRITEISSIRQDIKNGVSGYNNDNIEGITTLVRKNFPTRLLNSLPSYFESQIVKLAKELNYLNIVIWENYDKGEISEYILEHVLELNVSGLDRPTFEKNYRIVKQKNQRDKDTELTLIVVKKYVNFIEEMSKRIEDIENKKITPQKVLLLIEEEFNELEVNKIPTTFENVIDGVALSLNAASIAVWNSFENINVAIKINLKAVSVIKNVSLEVRDQILKSKSRLAELDLKIKIMPRSRLESDSSPQKKVQKTVNQTGNIRTPTENSSKKYTSQANNESKSDWVLIIILIIIFLGMAILVIDSKQTSRNKTSSEQANGSIIDTTTSSTLGQSANEIPIQNEPEAIQESIYKGNQLKNGASPLNSCFGKGLYSGDAYITFENSNSSDAIVCLVDYETQITIRNEYIRAGSDFTMNNIPTGTYYLKVYYGNDWNPIKENFCGMKGAFESDVHFSKSDSYSDLINVENSEYSYTTGRITLYAVANGNMSSQSMEESEFFNNK